VEEEITLKENDGRLFARFQMTHLSTWNLDQKIDACTPPASGKISINIDNTGRGFRARYADFYNAASGMTLSPTNANNIILIQSNEVHTLDIVRAPDVPSGPTGGLQFRLYNSVRSTSGFDETESNILCGESKLIDLTGDSSDCVHFEIYIECSDFSNDCFRPEMVGLWYEQGILPVGADPNDIEYQEAHYAGMPKDGAIDVDMTDIKNMVGGGASIYRFLLQFNSTSGGATTTHKFDLRFDGSSGSNGLWNDPGIDATVKTFNQIGVPPGSFCNQWYEILLEYNCGFDPGVHYPSGPGCSSL
jgi:hypothetical protein